MRQALWAGLMVGGLAALCSVLIGMLIGMSPMDPQVREIASRFLMVIAPAFVGIALFRALQAYMGNLGETRPTLVLTLVGLSSQLFFNWVFVFGNLGAPALGGFGPALSSVIGWALKAGLLMLWVRARAHYRDTQPFGRFEGPNWHALTDLFTLGLPLGISFLVEGSVFAVMPFLVAGFGPAELGAHQIAFNLSAFLILLPASLGYGLTTRVGLALGEGDRPLAAWRGRVGLGLAVGAALVVAVLLLGLRDRVAALYTADPTTAALAGTLLLILALYHLGEAVQTVASAVIRAYEEVRAIMVIQLVASWAIALPVGIVLGLLPEWVPGLPDGLTGVTGLWTGLAVGLGFAAISMLVLLRRTLAKAHAP